ncbi:MAG TPA: DNA recombination protein RmuC [Polyangia bacterium]|jgi:DNA recombination protein RmuC|nr:DNA recombination protein RmuC [Polyangia bacterium]
MEPIVIAAGALAGAAIGAVVGWLAAARRTGAAEATVTALRQQVDDARARADRLEQALRESDARRVEQETAARELGRGLAEQRRLLDDAEAKLADTFQALAAQALQQSSQGFLTLATEKLGAMREQAAGDLEARQRAMTVDLDARQRAIEGVVKPVKESIDKVDQQIRALEKERGHAYGALTEQVRGLARTQERLQTETGNLVNALRAPAVRGRWGEIQLRRVVELAGMLEHCDFIEQATVNTDDGRLRPDLLVRLPSGRNLVIDAKAPLGAYLEALEAPDEVARAACLDRHAAQVRAHILKLAAKSYWEQFPTTPEYVVLFLPGETFYSAALERMPSLIEEGVAQRVLLATPTTLIGVLQAVHYGWRQERVTENAQEISRCGRQLHERVATLVEHFVCLGNSLGQSVKHFNTAMASFEGRVLVSARRLEELDAKGKKEIPSRPQIDARPRALAPVEDLPVRGSELDA